VLLQWVPALASFTSDRRDASVQPAYFRPLLGFLARHGQPMGRVEVVPTHLHWEAADVAPRAPLARGWERQLDTADNPIFYTPGALTPASYRAWLLNNGVRWVALGDVALDYAGQAEALLLQRGALGLVPAWHDAHWRVFAVSGSTGIVDGPGRLLHLDARGITLAASSPGRLTVRVRASSLGAGDRKGLRRLHTERLDLSRRPVPWRRAEPGSAARPGRTDELLKRRACAVAVRPAVAVRTVTSAR